MASNKKLIEQFVETMQRDGQEKIIMNIFGDEISESSKQIVLKFISDKFKPAERKIIAKAAAEIYTDEELAVIIEIDKKYPWLKGKNARFFDETYNQAIQMGECLVQLVIDNESLS